MIRKSDFNFELSDKQIAKYPLSERDTSKLLVYRDGSVSHHRFRNIAEQLPADTLLVMNNAKVIPARLYFKRETRSRIVVLLLEPKAPSKYEKNYNYKKRCQWKCIIGNSKKWKDEEEIYLSENSNLLKARVIDRGERIVELGWSSGDRFTELLDKIGELPLPPYLNRDTEAEDTHTYQTVFAKNEGSVAAPTAGLHFTDAVFSSLEKRLIERAEVTLHVGAGTFLPVKEDNVEDHEMHREYFEVELNVLEKLVKDRNRITVGTTSLRVLESLYWLGCNVTLDTETLIVQKLEPYEAKVFVLTYEVAIGRLIDYLNYHKLTKLQAATEILILPHYTPRSITGLITNFHLPESTLLMLIASVVGDKWRDIYEEAKSQGYRFLSYGDSSLLFLQ